MSSAGLAITAPMLQYAGLGSIGSDRSTQEGAHPEIQNKAERLWQRQPASWSLVKRFCQGTCRHEFALYMPGTPYPGGWMSGGILVVPDEIEVIASDVVMFARVFNYVFTTGGVGPTHDDVTIEAIAHGLQWPLVIHPALDALLEQLWAERPSAARAKMASVPEGAQLH